MTADEVTAVIVTRGNVDLAPILETLPYAETIVWNDRVRGSQGCFGRYIASLSAAHKTIYYQDDDLIFTAHDELLAAYEPERIISNMPSPWYEQAGYLEMNCCLVGAGSLVPRDLYWPHFERYLERWPADRLFLTYCDQIFGILAPSTRHDFGYEVLPYASAPDRIYTQPGAPEAKWLVQRRALALREEVVPA